MQALWPTINRWLTWFHRWAGVALCLLFVVWFASGAVLHFVGFPSLPAAERVSRAEEIDLSRLKVSPSQALALAGAREQDGLRLISVDRQPVYVASAGMSEIALSGDSGERLSLISPAGAKAVAARFAQAPAIRVEGPLDYDQWVVHQQFDPYRPFFKVRLNDPQATDLYISARTGEVLQRTRESERFWNWCGAILHWIYFTPVRRDWPVWNQLVWWVSLGALLTSIAGTWLGIHRYLKTRTAGRAGLSPFRGWMRWHHVVGLFTSLVVLGWIFSGWLSMDHGRLFSRGGVTAEQIERMRGMSLSAIANASTLELVRSAGPATAIVLNAVAGRPFLTVRGGAGSSSSRLLWLDTVQTSQAPVPQSLLIAGLHAVWPAVEPITRSTGSDPLYRLAESVPPDALAACTAGSNPTRIYVDPFSGRLLTVMDGSRRAYAWVYYGVHTLNFPGLSSHPSVRTTLVVSLVLCGLAFSITGVVLGIRRVKLQFS